MSKVRTYEDLVALVSSRAKSASAAAPKTASTTPEAKDPNEKGNVGIPVDPNASNTTMKLPTTGTNTEVTPVTQPPAAKTVSGEEKAATVIEKAQKVASAIRTLAGSIGKSASAAEITPNMPSDKGSTNADTHPAPSTDNGPAHHQNPDPVTKGAAPTPDAADPAAKKIEMPKGDSKGEIPTNPTNTNDVTTKKSEEGCMVDGKMASNELPLDFDPSFHFKLASLILQSEAGRELARQVIESAHGAQEAANLIKCASFMESEAQRLAELEAQGAFAAEKAWQEASPAEQEAILKMAFIHQTAKASLATEEEKLAFDKGAAAASGMMDMSGGMGGMGGGMGGAGGPPGGAAPAPAPGPLDQDAPAPGSDDISDEDIMAVLDELVQSGQIKPEEAQAIMQALAQGADGGAGGADPTGGAGAPGMEAPGSPEQKEASLLVKSASSIVDSILVKPAAAPAK